MHRVSLKTPSVQKKGVFMHRKRVAYHRRPSQIPNITPVPEKPVFYTECLRKRVAYHRRGFLRTARIFRTTGGPLRYRMSRMPKTPNATNAECHKCQGEEASSNIAPLEIQQMPGGRGLSSIAPPTNSSQMLGKRFLPQTAPPEIQQTPEKRPLPV